MHYGILVKRADTSYVIKISSGSTLRSLTRLTKASECCSRYDVHFSRSLCPKYLRGNWHTHKSQSWCWTLSDERGTPALAKGAANSQFDIKLVQTCWLFVIHFTYFLIYKITLLNLKLWLSVPWNVHETTNLEVLPTCTENGVWRSSCHPLRSFSRSAKTLHSATLMAATNYETILCAHFSGEKNATLPLVGYMYMTLSLVFSTM